MCPCSSCPRQSADPEADGRSDSGAGDGAPCHTSSGRVRRDAVLSGVVACCAVGRGRCSSRDGSWSGIGLVSRVVGLTLVEVAAKRLPDRGATAPVGVTAWALVRLCGLRRAPAEAVRQATTRCSAGPSAAYRFRRYGYESPHPASMQCPLRWRNRSRDRRSRSCSHAPLVSLLATRDRNHHARPKRAGLLNP